MTKQTTYQKILLSLMILSFCTASLGITSLYLQAKRNADFKECLKNIDHEIECKR